MFRIDTTVTPVCRTMHLYRVLYKQTSFKSKVITIRGYQPWIHFPEVLTMLVCPRTQCALSPFIRASNQCHIERFYQYLSPWDNEPWCTLFYCNFYTDSLRRYAVWTTWFTVTTATPVCSTLYFHRVLKKQPPRRRAYKLDIWYLTFDTEDSNTTVSMHFLEALYYATT